MPNGFVISLELYHASCHVKVARVFNCQSHLSVLAKQLKHKVISHICYGLTNSYKRKTFQMKAPRLVPSISYQKYLQEERQHYHFILLHSLLQFILLKQCISIHLSSICGTYSFLHSHISTSFALQNYQPKIINMQVSYLSSA